MHLRIYYYYRKKRTELQCFSVSIGEITNFYAEKLDKIRFLRYYKYSFFRMEDYNYEKGSN